MSRFNNIVKKIENTISELEKSSTEFTNLNNRQKTEYKIK